MELTISPYMCSFYIYHHTLMSPSLYNLTTKGRYILDLDAVKGDGE